MDSPAGCYEFFDHAADVGIRCCADSIGDLFQLAARALMEWMGPPPDGRETVGLTVFLEAEDREDLLVRWLQELMYLFHQRHLYFIAAGSLCISESKLEGEVLFRLWDESSYREYQEVKAITYHQLRVYQERDSWHASVILDI